jgi:hypothetical protein
MALLLVLRRMMLGFYLLLGPLGNDSRCADSLAGLLREAVSPGRGPPMQETTPAALLPGAPVLYGDSLQGLEYPTPVVITRRPRKSGQSNRGTLPSPVPQ